MGYSPLWWIGLNLLSLLVLSFYSSMEMACVSFNKVRLQYFVSKGNRSALLLHEMLQNSYRLFGTTLIGVNVAIIFGSEFSRQFHSAIGLSPDWAPLTQVMIVVIFGELAPMFAARRYAEHMVMLGIRLLYASSLLMTPILFAIRWITQVAHWLIGGHEETPNFFLSQEELQKLIEEGSDSTSRPNSDELDEIVSNIFNLRHKRAWQIMTPLYMIPMIPSNCTIANLRKILKNTPFPFLPVYHRHLTNIVGIALPRDLIRESEHKRVRERSRQPWFITQDAEILHILRQFRKNNQSVAVVLDEKGLAVGMITLEDLFEEIFGKEIEEEKGEALKKKPSLFIERTFPGDMKISEFNRLYKADLQGDEIETLAELITHSLGHSPEEGDTVLIPPFELTVKEASLLEIKTISVRTVI